MPVAGATYALANRDAYYSLADKHVGQGFAVAGGNRGLYDLTVQLIKQGSPTGNIQIAIFDNDGGLPGTPIENGVSTTVLDASTVSGAGASYTFAFTPPFLLNGGTYYFVVIHSGDWDGTNYVQLGVDASSPTGTSSLMSWANSDDEWIADVTRDVTFTSQYTDVVPDAPEDEDIDIDWDCADCDNQPEQMEEMITAIANLQTVMLNLLRPTIEIYSPFFPSQGYWESEWLKQGGTLPIPDGANLLWYDTSNARFGGSYTVIDGVVYDVAYKLPKGSIYGFSRPGNATNDGTSLSTASYASGTIGNVDFVVAPLVPSKLIIYYPVYVTNNIAWSMFIGATNTYHTQFGTAGAVDSYGRFLGGTNTPHQIHHPYYATVDSTFTGFSIKFIGIGAGGQFQAYVEPITYAAMTPPRMPSTLQEDDFGYAYLIVE